MFNIHFKTIIRNLRKTPALTAIKITGLAIGITCTILVYVFVNNEFSYDKFHLHANNIYRVAIEGHLGNTEINQAYSCAPLPKALYTECPEIESIVRIAGYGSRLKYGDKVFFENNQIMADSSFFSVFSHTFIEGNPKTALSDPNTMVITESFAKRVFGNEMPIGKSILHEDRNVTVTGVIKDVPKNSHLQFDFIFSVITFTDYIENNNWYNNNFRTYIRLKDGFDYKTTEAKFPEILKKYTGNTSTYESFTTNGNYWHFYLQPLTSIHLNSDISGEFEANGDKKYVQIFILIGIFILLIACVNYMNLTTARSSNRANEIGIKKVVGSSKRFLIAQFLTESVLVTFVSLLFALVLVKIIIPHMGTLLNRELNFSLAQNWFFLPILLGIALFVGIAAGSYPAFFLSNLKPVLVLKGKTSTGNKSTRFRNGLVIFQFSISVVLIVATIIINKQLNYIKNDRLGFNKEHVLVIKNRFLLDCNNELVREELNKIPGVKKVCLSHSLPGRNHNNWGMRAEGIENLFTLNVCGVDQSFLEVMDLKMVKGRFFNDSIESDRAGMVINESAAKLFPDDQILGNKLNGGRYTIIGVTEDYHYESMHQKVRPMALLYTGGSGGLYANYISIRTMNAEVADILKKTEQFWNRHSQGSVMEYTFLDEDYGRLYDNEQQTSKLFTIFSVLAIIIACLGLIGLSTFMIEQRIKEIGVRKVNGAKIFEIVKMLNLDFAIWVIIAYVISCPLAYWGINSWLNTFAYRTKIGWFAFLIAGSVALAIALLTVS